MRGILILLASAIGLSAFAGAKIEWDKSRHDFGAFDESLGPVTAVFTFTNTGDEPLVVTGARANCGCTTPTYSADVVEPGASATLSVTYNPAGLPGRFEKKVYVDTNTDPKRSTLSITGVCVGSPSSVAGKYPVEVGPLRLTHPTALLGAVTKGHIKSTTEYGYNASTDTLRPVVKGAPKWLEVKPMKDKVAPGEQAVFGFFVHSDKIPGWDLVTDTVTIYPYEDSADFLRMLVVVTVNEDFSSLSDKQLADAPAVRFDATRLAPVSPGSEAVLTVHNDGKSALKIRRVYTRTPGVTFDVKSDETVKGGKSRAIKARIPSDCLSGTSASAVIVTVITNDPLNPHSTITIPVTSAL